MKGLLLIADAALCAVLLNSFLNRLARLKTFRWINGSIAGAPVVTGAGGLLGIVSHLSAGAPPRVSGIAPRVLLVAPLWLTRHMVPPFARWKLDKACPPIRASKLWTQDQP